MFGWLTALRWRNRKQIFKFWDGERWRYADPLVLYRGLSEHPEYVMDRTPRELQGAMELDRTKDVLDLTKLTAQAVYDVFGVKPLDDRTGKGLAQAECITLLESFAGYMNALKKNTRPTPMSSPSTECPGESATSNTSDCSSTDSVHTTSAPQELGSESAPLSAAASCP